VYANEPVTRGKVVLHTTLGPLDVELWAKEAPLACRNFVQLGLEGYYDGCNFHRVIKDFMAQTGDPTGTGTGGDSSFGGEFKDETHGRLRFTHRGLLGMASSGPNTNRSQFFVTLDRCEWLDNKHTIFGKVTGNSLYNLNRFGDLELGDDDRPLYPPRILRMEVLLEPFDDIVPRPAVAAAPTAEEEARKRRKKEKKNLSLLSFGDEAEAEEVELSEAGARRKVLSSHDALEDPRLSRQVALDPQELAAKLRKQRETDAHAVSATARMRSGGEAQDAEMAASDFDERMRQQMQSRRAQMQGARSGAVPDEARSARNEQRSGAAGGGAASSEGGEGSGKVNAAREEYARLRKELSVKEPAKGAKAAAAGGEGATAQDTGGEGAKPAKKWRGKGAADSDDEEASDGEAGGATDGMSELERRRAKFLERKRTSMMLSKKQRQSATLQA